MVTIYTRSATARQLWALPGAVLTTRGAQLVNGVVRPGTTPQRIPCPAFLIEHERGFVLFDAGVSPRGLDDPEAYFGGLAASLQMTFTPDLAIDVQLGQLGLTPARIRYVIASHLHFDHAGGLYLFPEATLLVGAGELPYAYWPPPAQRGVFLLNDLLPTRGFEWVELESDHDLFGDGSVVILRTPGHTPGELSLLVRLPNQTLILTGDACHYRLELEAGMPVSGLFASNVQEATRSIQRLRLLRSGLEARVWINHDPEDWAELAHAPVALR
jgi:glyoxylase-like metal-dependent hydrolase (beta-lactamase superfamily II)